MPSADTARAQAANYLVPANLLAGDEIIILMTKPSGWFIWLVSGPVAATAALVAAVAIAAAAYGQSVPLEVIETLCAAAVLLRLLGAWWQWLGRTYVLTNRRIITVRGLMRVSVAEAPLAAVAKVELSATLGERAVGAASLYCTGASGPPARVVWNTLNRPQEVIEIVNKAVRQAHG